jgi:hypothetical protein
VIVTAAIVALLVLAIVKPWSFGASGGPATGSSIVRPSRSPDAALLTPSASPRPPEDPNGMLCLSGDTEQVVLLERWAGNEVRSWIVATDRAADGPLDPGITRIAIYSGHVIGLGICAPEAIGGSVAAGAQIQDVQVLSQGERGLEARDLGLPDRISATTDTPDAAVLYGAPHAAPIGASPRPDPAASDGPTPATSGSGPTVTTWPTGAYVIAFVFPGDPSGRVRWLRVDLLGSVGPG